MRGRGTGLSGVFELFARGNVCSWRRAGPSTCVRGSMLFMRHAAELLADVVCVPPGASCGGVRRGGLCVKGRLCLSWRHGTAAWPARCGQARAGRAGDGPHALECKETGCSASGTGADRVRGGQVQYLGAAQGVARNAAAVPRAARGSAPVTKRCGAARRACAARLFLAVNLAGAATACAYSAGFFLRTLQSARARQHPRRVPAWPRSSIDSAGTRARASAMQVYRRQAEQALA